jgi:hypothetical protein
VEGIKGLKWKSRNSECFNSYDTLSQTRMQIFIALLDCAIHNLEIRGEGLS